MKKLILLAAVAALAITAAPALAQFAADGVTPLTPAVPAVPVAVVSTGTWAGEVLTWLAAAFAGPVGLLITAALWKLFKLLGVQVTDQMKDQLQGIIVNGLNKGAANLSDKLQGQGKVEIKSAIVADAVKYTQDHAGETMKALGLDPQSGAAVEAIKARIETALNDPGTPTPPIITPAAGTPDVAVVTRPAAQ